MISPCINAECCALSLVIFYSINIHVNACYFVECQFDFTISYLKNIPGNISPEAVKRTNFQPIFFHVLQFLLSIFFFRLLGFKKINLEAKSYKCYFKIYRLLTSKY
jgi:hypothetical protein